LQKRSLFKKIFGRETPPPQTNYKQYELISTSNSTFVSFDGNIFDNDIVRSALRPKANAIGKLNVKHIKGEGISMKVNPDKQVKEILKKPNPYMSMQDFLMKMTYQREINHNAFAYVKRDEFGGPQEIYPIPYSSIKLIEIDNELFCKFHFMMGKYMTVPYFDLIHLRKDFYKNDFFGESGVAALKNIMEVIVTTDQGIVNAVKNSAVIKWILKFKSVLQPKDVEMQVKEFIKNYLSISNEGGAAASDPRYDLEQVKDNNYVPNALQMKEAIQRLYSYFGVNEAIVQNKYKEDEYGAFYESELEPIIIQLSESFTDVFFTKEELKLGNKIIFEASNLTFASIQTKLQLVQLLDRGIMNSNEIRRILNLPPVEGGDEYVRRLDTVPIKNENEGENETDDDSI
jgi:HK97 family phage portal protein